jgi:hypothetical protein
MNLNERAEKVLKDLDKTGTEWTKKEEAKKRPSDFDFKITSGKIHCTDPCYSIDTWCGNYNLRAQNGDWVATIYYDDIEERVACWKAWLVEKTHQATTTESEKWERLPNEIGVDSGQAGIFDASIYPKTKKEQGEYGEMDTFYGKCCDATLHTTGDCGTVVNQGFLSSTGYGDGEYTGYVLKNEQGEIFAVKVVFIDDEPLEEDKETENYN